MRQMSRTQIMANNDLHIPQVFNSRTAEIEEGQAGAEPQPYCVRAGLRSTVRPSAT